MNLQRLDKIIANQFNLPRKITKACIHRGKVRVDGKVVRDPAMQVDVDSVKIEYRGQAMEYKEHLYLILNKPKGVLSASTDKNRQTVVDLVPEGLKRQGLFPVGRLDKDTTGLLIITDDGDFAHNVISPKKELFKTYRVTLDGDMTDEKARVLEQGVTLADGTRLKKCVITQYNKNLCEIKILEGKYHQIKRMFGVVELGVNELERIAVGKLLLPEDLKVGDCRELEKTEIECIFNK